MRGGIVRGMEPMRHDGWTPCLRLAWERIARHDLAFGRPLDFTTRLARDRGWRMPFARAAIEEYRRFCFLAVSGAQVTPSEEVDEVWHQHLTYSRDYWEVWCPDVLRMRLHHQPTEGSAADQTRYRAQYAATLARYETYFGPPPVALWPATHVRFGPKPRFRVVDAADWWVLPRPAALWRRLRATAERP